MNLPELNLVGVASPRRPVGCRWISEKGTKGRENFFHKRRVYSAGHLGEMTLPFLFPSVVGRRGV